MSTKINVVDELGQRGLIAQSTDRDQFRDHLEQSRKFYVGFDPTAPSLHMGNLVQLITATRLQRLCHQPHLLIGGATGMIGDPRDAGERSLNTAEVVSAFAAGIKDQVVNYVDFDGPVPAQIVNNLDWTKDLSVIDFLRDIGKHFPVNRMLARDVVRNRLADGISFTEFSYVLLQSMDFLNLRRNYGVTFQFGGSDQWGNISAGVELIRRADGEHVHGFGTPLLTKADGSKFGKSEGGAIWLDPQLTSPFAFHQFLMNSEDEKVIEQLRVFTFKTAAEIDELAQATQTEPQARKAQQVLADEVTTMVHGQAETQQANRAAKALFGQGELADLPAGAVSQIATEVGVTELPVVDGQLPLAVDVLAASQVVPSKGAARRAISEGGAYLNNQRITDQDYRIVEEDVLAGDYLIVRRGRKTLAAVQLVRG